MPQTVLPLPMQTCPRRGEENPERARFCLNRGEALAEPEPRRTERKYARALFADLVGSTSLAECEDPEIVQSIVGRAFDRLAEESGATRLRRAEAFQSSRAARENLRSGISHITATAT